MFIPLHPHQRDQKQFHFGERRTVNFLGLGVVGKVAEGLKNAVVGAPAQVKEKAGMAMQGLNWMTSAKTLPGYILFSPFIVTRKLVEGVIGGYGAVNDAALILGTKVGSIVQKPVNDLVGLTRDVIEQTLSTAYGCTVKPAMEIVKSSCIDFPTRAIVDNFRTGLKTIFGTIGTVANHSIEAAKQTVLMPFTVIKATRDAATELLWNAPKALLNGEFAASGKHLVNAPMGLAEGVLKAPAAIAAVPYHAAMELGLGGIATAMNASSAMAAPVEGMVNAYRAIGQTGESTLNYLKAKLGVGAAGAYRDRFKELFSGHSPIAATA